MLSSFESRGSALRSQGEFWRKQTWLSLTSSSVFLFSFGFECLSFCRMYFYSQPCHEVRLFQIAGSCRNFPRDGRSTHYLHAQIGLTIYAWACVCVYTFVSARQSIYLCMAAAAAAAVATCLFVRCSSIYKRDRRRGKESRGNEKWPIKCFQSSISKLLHALMPHPPAKKIKIWKDGHKNPTFTFMEAITSRYISVT